MEKLYDQGLVSFLMLLIRFIQQHLYSNCATPKKPRMSFHLPQTSKKNLCHQTGLQEPDPLCPASLAFLPTCWHSINHRAENTAYCLGSEGSHKEVDTSLAPLYWINQGPQMSFLLWNHLHISGTVCLAG